MGLVETSLEVVKLATKIANPELVQTATKANIEALELSAKNLELHKHTEALEHKVKALEAQLALTGEVFSEGGFAYREGVREGFCSRCWDVDHKLVHIIQMHRGKGEGVGPGCPECKTFTWGHGSNPRMK